MRLGSNPNRKLISRSMYTCDHIFSKMYPPPPPPRRKRATQRLGLALTSLTALSIVTFVSCKKEVDPTGPLDTGIHKESTGLEPRIRAFVASAGDPSLRGGTTLSADSAEWYIEAALNFSNANITTSYNGSRVDSLIHHLPVTDEVVTLSDAAAAYNTLSAQIASSNVPDLSHVIIVDVTSVRTGDGLTLTVAYATGSGYGKALNTGFGSNDHWMWGGGGSNCNCAPNTGAGTCADKKIEQRINNELTALGQSVYMINVETWKIMPYEDVPNKVKAFSDFPVSGSPYGHRSYGCGGSGCNTCLSPSNMTFFTQGTWDVMNLIKQQYCPTKTAQYCFVAGNMGGDTYWHQAQFSYGHFSR